MKYVIPILVAALLAYALIRRVNPYEAFIRGAADAVPTLLRVLPALAAMLGAITLLRGCGALDALGNWLSPVFEKIGIPSELTPLILLRPFSGSASLALLGDTLTRYGADSFVGRAASVCVGSTETIFYTLALYCGSVGISKTRHALPAALAGCTVLSRRIIPLFEILVSSENWLAELARDLCTWTSISCHSNLRFKMLKN